MKILIVKRVWVGLLAVLVMASAGCSPAGSVTELPDQIPVTGGNSNAAGSIGNTAGPAAVTIPRHEETADQPLPLESATPVPEPTVASAALPVVQPSPSHPPEIEPSTAPTASITAAPGKHVLVDLSEQRVYAYENGVLVYEFPVSTGRNDNTAVGVFKILDKKPYPYSEPWGFWMPHWMGIYWVAGMENGFHALPVLENGKELWGDQIGTPASNGCIVLLPEDMAALFEWSEVGMPVEIVE